MKKVRETSSPSSSHHLRVSSSPNPHPHQQTQQTHSAQTQQQTHGAQQVHGVQEQQQRQDGGAPSPFADAPCASAEHVRLREMYGRSTMFELLDNDDIPLHYLRSGMRLVFAYELTFRRHEDYAAMYLLTHSSSASGFGVPYFVSTGGGDCAELEKRVSAALHVAGVFVNYACVRKDEVSRAFFLSLDVSISLSARRSLRLGLANLDDDAVACRRGRTWWDRLPRDEEKRLRDMQQDLGPCVIGHLAARTDTDKVLWSRGEIRYFFFRHK